MPDSLDAAQVAAALGVSRRTVYRLIHDRLLLANRIRGQWRVPAPALHAYIKACSSAPPAPDDEPTSEPASEAVRCAVLKEAVAV